MPPRSLLLAAIRVTLQYAGAVAAELVGIAHVVDGDTLELW